MQLLFRDLNKSVCVALSEAFRGVPEVSVACADILCEPADAVVSPANSFGMMDGGIDAVYVRRLGAHIEQRVQLAIRETRPFGELLVGDALRVETASEQFPHMIVAPTMRFPGPTTAEAVFLAMRAAVTLMRPFPRVACPGLGAWSGRVPAGDAVRAMRAGYDTAMHEVGKAG